MAARAARHELEAALKRDFRYTTKGPLHHFLGFVITRVNRFCIKISQEKFVRNSVSKHGLTDAKTAITPAQPNVTMSVTDCPTSDAARTAMAGKPFLNRVGDAQWVAHYTRPDAAYAANSLAHFGSNPGMDHWHATSHLLRYLGSTPTVGITYSRNPHPLHVYVDSDYNPNYGDRSDNYRATTGWVAFYAGGWQCHR